MRSLSSGEVRNSFSDTLNQVADGLEHIAIHLPDTEPVYMIPSRDYKLFLELLAKAEDKLDLQEAEDRMMTPQQKRLDFDEFFAELEV